MELFGWEKAKEEQEASGKAHGRYLIGAGVAAAPHASSLYGVFADTTGVMLKMNEDGSLTMFTGDSDMGNGSNTVQMMVVSEVLGISMDRIACVKTDTRLPYMMWAHTPVGAPMWEAALLSRPRTV